MGQGQYAVLDFETTGLRPRRGHRIIEVAIVHLDEDFVIGESWETLVNPARHFTPGPHQITPSMVRQAPRSEEIIGDIASRIEGRIVVAHNAAFERVFLESELRRSKILGSGAIACTAELSARAGLPRALARCCQELEIRHGQPHRAASDAEATAHLLQQLVLRSGRPKLRPWTLSSALPATTGISWTREQATNAMTTPNDGR